jgi:hypothetical protein
MLVAIPHGGFETWLRDFMSDKNPAECVVLSKEEIRGKLFDDSHFSGFESHVLGALLHQFRAAISDENVRVVVLRDPLLRHASRNLFWQEIPVGVRVLIVYCPATPEMVALAKGRNLRSAPPIPEDVIDNAAARIEFPILEERGRAEVVVVKFDEAEAEAE